MATRDLISNPCQDACATIKTDRRFEGAPIYLCPGCDAEWIELDERTEPGASGQPQVTPTPSDADEADPALEDHHFPQGSPSPATASDVHPQLLHTVLDAHDIRALAEFYRQLLGLVYRPGDAPPFVGADDADWLVLTYPDGRRALAFQFDDHHVPPTWPKVGVPQQLHLDMTVPDRDALEAVRARAVRLGATVLLDRTHDADEPLYVFADPAGHPFCIFVA
ncbi:MAG TPA: VOC family protein [Propioniciclava tarda]|nr:VOC family protein [Propioniciclava tarda]